MFEFVISNFQEISSCAAILLKTLSLENLCEEDKFTVRLVLDELAVNVLKHSRCRAGIEGKTEDGKLVITVRGDCPFCPKDIDFPALFCESGRGVFLVRRLCEDFFYEEDGRKAVAVITLKREE